MDLFLKILHAIAKKQWSVALRVFFVALCCAVAYPIITVVAGLDVTTWSPLVIKTLLTLTCITGAVLPLWIARWKWNMMPQWQRCAIPLAFLAAITWAVYSVTSRHFGTVPTETVVVFC
ncbi:MAG: hypothetical protein U1A23_00730, partial [Candidatus Sungbacteria bacterium]|nr:hypothetical protein [Candidatus Sungbacteria bacterium]